MKARKNLKIAVLLFAMVFAVGAAFAVTNGMLAFGGTVRINTSPVTVEPLVELSFVDVSVMRNETMDAVREVNVELVNDGNGRQTMHFDIDVFDFTNLPHAGVIAGINFAIENHSDVPVRFLSYEQAANAPWFGGSLSSHGFMFLPPGGWGEDVGVPPAMANNVVLQPGETVRGVISLSIRDLIEFIEANNINPTEQHTFESWFTIVYEVAQ